MILGFYLPQENVDKFNELMPHTLRVETETK